MVPRYMTCNQVCKQDCFSCHCLEQTAAFNVDYVERLRVGMMEGVTGRYLICAFREA